MDDGAKLHLRRWTPAGQRPVGAVLLVHGMAEHAGRYERLARRFCAEGLETWAADQRGHGLTANLQVNAAGAGGLLGHCADGDGFSRVVADINMVSEAIHRERPGLPVILMGHSWGSFLVKEYLEVFDTGPAGANLAGCVLSGTTDSGGAKVVFGAPFLTALALLKGQRAKSPLAHSLSDGAFNKPFRPNRTPYDWLTRDEAEIDRLADDPFAGMMCSVGFYRDMTRAMLRIHKMSNIKKIRTDLPIYLFSGSADPVGDMGRGPTALVALLRKAGVRDIEFVLYPDARHEPLNETNREEVTVNLLAWIKKHLG
jgi:alpha-beta hydrolase superfamily lysophospholipase